MKIYAARVWLTFSLGICVLGLSGCSLFSGEPDDPMDYLRERVRNTVSDDTRAAAMTRTVDQMDVMLRKISDLLVDTAGQERELFRDYDSTPKDFETLLEKTFQQRRNMQQAALALHLEFKSQATAEEWRTLMPAESRAVSARVESLVLDAVASRNN